MDFLRLPHEGWREFFDGMNAVMGGKQVEIDVMGLDLGDAIQAEWVPLNGITYEPREDNLFVFAGAQGSSLEHVISHPKEISVEFGEEGVNRVVVADDEGHQQFLRLRSPLALPTSTTNAIH